MAKKKTPRPTASPAAPRRRAPKPTGATPPVDLTAGPSYDEIAKAAYHRYLNRGASDGRDFDDWLEAERELRSRR